MDVTNNKNDELFISEKTQLSQSVGKEDILPVFAKREETWDFFSFLGILPDPDPVLQKLSEGPEILTSLLADGHLTSVVQTRKVGTLAKEYDFEEKSDDAKSKRIYEAFEADINNLNIRNIISQLLDAVLYGYTPVEIMWEDRDGMKRISGLRPLPFRWFSFDAKTNEPVFLSQKSPINGLPLPAGKFVFARHNDTFDNPFGNRLLSRCFWPVYFKRSGLKFWVRFLEKFAGVFLVGKTPNMKEAGPMFEQLKRMVQNAVAVIGSDSELQVMQGNVGGTTDAYERFKVAMDSDISKIILGQTLTTEVGDKGTQALGSVHETVLDSYRESDQAMIKTFFDDLAWVYCQINDVSAIPPEFCWKKEEEAKAELATRDKTLSEIGVEFTKEYFLTKYGFSEGDINMTVKAIQGTLETRVDPVIGPNFAEAVFPDQDAIDNFARSIPVGKMTGLIDPVLKPVLNMIKEGKDYEEIIGKISTVYPEMETNDLEETIARCIFVSEVYGRLSASKGK